MSTYLNNQKFESFSKDSNENIIRTIESLKVKEKYLFNKLYLSEDTSSSTWKLLSIISAIAFIIALLFNHTNIKGTILLVSFITFIIGVIKTSSTEKEEKKLSMLLSEVQYELKEVEQKLKKPEEK